MPSFGGGGFSFGGQAPPSASAPASVSGFGGAPNADALRAAMPANAPPLSGGGGPDLGELLGALLGGAGAAGSPPPAAPPPPQQIPVEMPMMPAGVPPPAINTTPPAIGITPPDEHFVQAFRADNGRYPSQQDYHDRAWTMSYFRTQGRWPTQLEFLMQLDQPTTDGPPEYALG